MAIAVEDQQAEGREPNVVTGPQARRAGIGMKKLLMVPIAFAAVFALIDGPNHDGLANGGIYGAMIGGSGLAAAILCAKSRRDLMSILTGEGVGTFVGRSLWPRHVSWDLVPPIGPDKVVLIAAVAGWLAMQPFRLRRPKSVSNPETTLAKSHDTGA